jgi:hypothetical protein
VTPVFTETTTVLAVQALAMAANVRATVDLRTAFGAFLLCKIGRTSATVITGTTTAGVDLLIRRVWNNDAGVAGSAHPAGLPALLSSTVAANSTTLNGAVSANATTAVVTSATGLVNGDIVFMADSASAFTRAEWARISKVVTTTVTFDRPLQLAHNSGDLFTNKADVFAPLWVPGGSLYEVIFDAGDDSGPTIAVSCLAQIYASDTIS